MRNLFYTEVLILYLASIVYNIVFIRPCGFMRIWHLEGSRWGRGRTSNSFLFTCYILSWTGLVYIYVIVIVSSHIIDHTYLKKKKVLREIRNEVEFNKWKVEIILGLYSGRDKELKNTCLKEMEVGEDTIFWNWMLLAKWLYGKRNCGITHFSMLKVAP